MFWRYERSNLNYTKQRIFTTCVVCEILCFWYLLFPLRFPLRRFQKYTSSLHFQDRHNQNNTPFAAKNRFERSTLVSFYWTQYSVLILDALTLKHIKLECFAWLALNLSAVNNFKNKLSAHNYICPIICFNYYCTQITFFIWNI